MNNNRVTVVLGAGAALELAPEGCEWPTTENITKSILCSKPKTWDLDTKSEREVSILSEIYERLCASYHCTNPNGLDPDAEGSAGKVHFEIIFHILELLDTYNRSWRGRTAQKNVAPFASFITSTFNYNPNDLYVASRFLLENIIDKVIEYDSRFNENKNDWYRDFWKNKEKLWDVFNFNYDTTVEQSLVDYEDGYDEIADEKSFKRFNINKLLDNIDNLSTVNHIHGCILYGNDRYKDINHDVYDYEHADMYKWPDAKTAKAKWLGIASSHSYAQNGQTIIQGPIITGLSKTEKITCLPYDIYRYNLLRSVQRNRGLLIAGYSFGDKYANHALYRMSQCHGEDKKVVLIDFWDIKKYCLVEEGYDFDKEEITLNPRILENYFDTEYGNEEELLFIKRIAHHDFEVWHHFNQLSLDAPMVSDNGQLMLLIGGMKSSLSKYYADIYEFLDV